jgi:DNA-binding SARP family transcriptional activator
MASRVPLRLTLIGGFALRRGSQELGIATSGQRLIALLALEDRPVGRLHVAGMLWPDYSTERSLADLRTALWRVKQSKEQVIAATSSFLGLDDSIEVDVHDLTAFARRLNRTGTASESVELDSLRLADLVGDLLPDWYDDWVQDAREALRQTRLHALESLARRLSASGRHPGRTCCDSPGTITRDCASHPHRDPSGRGKLVRGLSPVPAVSAVTWGRTRRRATGFDAPPA